MKRYLFSVLAAAPLLLLPAASLAHGVVADGTMTVTLRIEPDDAPAVGIPQTLELFYAEPAGSFDLARCDCQVTITDPKGGLVNAPVQYMSATEGKVPITFARAGAYAVKTTGVAKPGASFESFAIAYDVEVAAAPADRAKAQHRFELGLMAGGGVIALLMILTIVWFVIRGNKPKTGNPTA